MNITEKILKYSLIFTFFILVVCFLIFPVTDLDIWMHLVTGKYIVGNFKIPASDFYSYTAFGRPWIDHEWFFQAIVYGFYHLGGLNGLIILRLIFFFSIFFLSYFIIRQKSNWLLAVLSSLLVLFVAQPRLFLRPEVFTLLFVIIYIFILEKYLNQPTRLIYSLPLLQIIWVNSHGYFLLGIIIPLLFLIGCFLQRRKGLSFLFLLVLFLILVSFINPYGYQGFFYPVKILTSLDPQTRAVLGNISELKSPFLNPDTSIFWFKLLIAASLISFLLSFSSKVFNLGRFFVYFIFLILGLMVRRHLALFAFVITLITIYNLSEIKKIKGYLGKIKNFKYFLPVKIFALFFLLAYLLVFIFNITSNRFYLKERVLKTFSLGITPELFPQKAVDFLLEHNFKGRIFNDMIGGSYLVWRYYPDQKKVFLDGRTEVYGPLLFKDYMSVFNQPDKFQEISQKYEIDYVLLNHSLGGRIKLIKYLLQDKNWAMVYFDQIAIVFIKNTPQNNDFIKKFRVNLDELQDPDHPFWINISQDYQKKKWPGQKLFPYGFLKAGYLFSDLEYLKQAEISFKKGLELNPDFDLFYLALGNVYSKQKLYLLALKCYKRALSLNSTYYEIYYNMALAYEDQKLILKAEKYYRKSISLNPRFYAAYYNLGFLYFEQKKFNPAIKQFKKAIKLNSSFAQGYSVLGASLANKRQFSAASKILKKAVSLNPQDKQSFSNLAFVFQEMGQYNAAIAQWLNILTFQPDNLEARHNLALCYLSAGLPLKARELWLMISKQDPNNRQARDYLKKLERLGYENAFN